MRIRNTGAFGSMAKQKKFTPMLGNKALEK
jgi:hypothetical protein